MTNQNLTFITASQCGLNRVKNLLKKRKGIKFLHMSKNQKLLLSIMLTRFENFDKTECKQTLLGVGFILNEIQAKAFGYNITSPLVFTLDTHINSSKINIIPMCAPHEF
jgi:hypothetical protein